MTADEIRLKYLKFFKSKKHKVVASDSLVPANDPSVLFTGAGMNQFKEQFMGINISFKRATSCQKCLRTGDLNNVGKTAGHHTFFEMLGNFSFGDYFKKEAIEWGWEFMTKELKLPPERLWVSVYKDDEEAYEVWRDLIKVPEHKIKRYGADDNFWPANAPEEGPNGPCGPCSEIFYDQGKDAGCNKGEDCEPSCGCDRFVEVWNLVFTQFNRVGKNKLKPLKSKNIDTGMGLERVAAVMQGVSNNFETDLFTPITGVIRDLTGSECAHDDPRVKAIADHIKAVSFMISDGILPSNEGRGYVERMLIRRAFRTGKELGIGLPFLYKLVPSVAKVMREPYPALETMREGIADVILNEEKRFQNTLEEGTRVLESIIEDLKQSGKSELSGEDAFKLYDTYGFPVELTEELAKSEGLSIDKKGYEKAMEKQRKLARSKSKLKSSIFDNSRDEDALKKLSEALKPTDFTGHKTCGSDAAVTAIVARGKRVKVAKEGEKIELILDKTPFYGEAGGQIGDSGVIISKKVKVRVDDARKAGGIIVHICEVLKGSISEKSKVKAIVDRDSRLDIARNHTATHLLHYALREVLGKHVKQSGSLVARDRLRFDFTHFKSAGKRELDRIEGLVNELVRANIKVKGEQLKIEEAKKKGAIALFGEKYGKSVRMVSVGDYSKELCGGTHLDSTGEIGLFRITSESSIAGGIRRIEALTGRGAYRSVKSDEDIMSDVALALKTSPKDVVKAAVDAALKIRSLEKEVSDLQSGRASMNIDELIRGSREINGVKVISSRLQNMNIGSLRTMTDNIKNRIGASIIVLGSEVKGKVALVCAVSKEITDKVSASDVIKKIAQIVGGSGGGRADFAQAGGKDMTKLDEALEKAGDVVREELEK
ncbi:MAG: alanine--tRNA ligase [Candidatus Omnitrophica bacterium]|nr:alanine--tRNA ligase [Candidatus Omnitrophota bacterium]